MTNPGFLLDVQGTNGTGYIAQIKNLSTATSAGAPGSSSDGLLINIGTANTSRTTGNYFVAFAGAGTVAGKIQGGASAVAYTTTAADYAEYFLDGNASAKPAEGDIVMLDTTHANSVIRATGSTALVGVVSRNPGFIGNGPLCQTDDNNCDNDYAQTNSLVGLSGQIITKVSTQNGSIQPGDPISLSDIPGVGAKTTQAGEIVGRALEAYNGSGIGTIKVLVHPIWYDPNNLLANLTLDASGNLVLPNTDPAAEVVALGGTPPAAPKKDLAWTLGDIVRRLTKLENATPSATSSAQPGLSGLVGFDSASFSQQVSSSSAHVSVSGKVDGLDSKLTDISSQFSDLKSKVASLEASLIIFAADPYLNASNSANLSVLGSSTSPTSSSSGLMVLEGLRVDGSATVSADLRVKGNGLVEGILNVIDTVMTKNLIVTKLAEFLDNATFHKDVVIEGTTTFNKDTAGYVVVKKDRDHVDVLFGKEYQFDPVINASLIGVKLNQSEFDQQVSNGDCNASAGISACEEKLDKDLFSKNIQFILTKRSSKGFSIVLNKNADSDMNFSWTAIQVGDGLIISPSPTP